jgi:DNA polymerase
MPSNLIERVIDFETISFVDLKLVGSSAYAQNPTTEVLCLSFEDYDGLTLTWWPWMTAAAPITIKLLDLIHDPFVTFVAHNAGFEKDIWRYIMVPVFGFPDIPNNRWDDTMAVAAMKQVPQDLDLLSRILRLPGGKDMEGSALVKSLSRPNKKTGAMPKITDAIRARVESYCETDVLQERYALNRLGRLSPQERQVWLLDQRINERGVKVDLDFVRAARKIVDDASGPLSAEFAGLTGGLKVTQAVKLKEWCNDQGANLPNLTKETLDALLGSDEDEEDDGEAEGLEALSEAVRRALGIRRLIGSASIKKLARMEACAGADGVVRRLLQYHGAGPGRWAGRLLQPQNFPRGTLKLEGKAPPVDLVVQTILSGDWQLVELMLGPAVEVVVSSLRHALIARPGRRFLSGDFSTIEARVVLALSGQMDKVEVLKGGQDIYIDMAQQIFKRPIDKKKDPEERQTGKNSVLGLGFGMGAPKFKLKYAKAQPLEFAKNIVTIYREEWAPEVPKLWRALERAACKTVWEGTPHEDYGVLYQLEDGWLTARIPSGRKLWYWNPQKTREAMPWDATDVRPSWTYQALKMGKKWKTINAFGGLLTENVVQALARDLLVYCMFLLEKNNFPLVLTVHDEALAEPEEKGVDEKAFTQLMLESPPWAKALQVPIAVETWTGERYRK